MQDISTVLRHRVEGRALVTGASGFIGRWVRRALLDAGADVVSIRRPSSPPASGGRSVEVDYADKEALFRLIRAEKPDLVFHVAGCTNVATMAHSRTANVIPTTNLVEAIASEHPTLARFVHVSSLAAYGPSKPSEPHREHYPRKPIEYYGQAKLEAEQVVEAVGSQIPWTIIRPGGVYGPADVSYFKLFKGASYGFNLFFGNQERWFSGLYVDDCVRAIVECALTDTTIGRGYFVCDGVPTTWASFQALIAKSVGRRVRTIDVPSLVVKVAATGADLLSRIDGQPRLLNLQKLKMGEQHAWTCTHEAAKTDFGYTPTVAQSDGVQRTLDWYRDNGWLR